MSGAGGDVLLTAGWAIWGKRPGSADDYWVLESSSEPVSAQDFARILAYFEPGTPPIERGRPDSLPWVTISWMSLSDQPYVGMAIQDATSDVDRAGRPITRTLYFCFPYASLASGPVSYVDLYHALASVQLPRPGGAQAEVRVPVLDPATLARDVTELDEAAISSAAALLLGGAVSVIGADGSTLDERLRFLDAVAALLPYGYRAGNTAATWADSGVRHPIRLAFAIRTKKGASGVAWHGGQPPMDDPSDASVSYNRQLRILRGHRAGSGGLIELIGFLARDTVVRGFDAPEPAVDGLREFDLPFAVLDDVHREAADPALVRRVFTSNRVTELPAGGRHELLAALLASGDPADVDVARAWWDQTATGDLGVLVTALAVAARGFLWRMAPAQRPADAYLRLAAEHELMDTLLARLVHAPADRQVLLAGRDAVVRTLADRIFDGTGTTTGAPDFPLTRQALATSPLVACALIARAAGLESGAAAVLDWLVPAADHLLAPFAAALGPAPSAVEPDQVAALAQRDDECARLLLTASRTAGRLDYVLPGFASWVTQAVAGRTRGAPLHTSYWRGVLTALTVDTPTVRAWIDLILLGMHEEPRFLLTDVAEGPEYGRAFADGWNQLTAGQHGRVVDETLTAELTGCLRRHSWIQHEARTATVTDIVRRLGAGSRRQRLEARVAAMVAATHRARAWPSVRKWLDQLLQERPDALREGTLSLLREPSAAATAAEIAARCVQAFSNELSARETAMALAQSGVVRTATDATRILSELRHLLPGSRSAEAWLLDFAEAYANGAAGWPVAKEFRMQAAEQSLDEIEFWLRLLSAGVVGRQQASAPRALTEEAAARLDQITKMVDQLLKQARPRSRRWGGGQRKDEALDAGQRDGAGT